MAFARDILPPTLNLEDPEPEAPFDHVLEPRTAVIQAALSNSFGFGGHNACLVLHPPRPVGMTAAVDDLRAIAAEVSCSAICDAMMRRHAHRAHVMDLVSPAPERWLLGPALTMQFLPLRADRFESARHDFGALLLEAVGEGDPAGHVLAVSSWGHPDAPIAGGKKLSRLRQPRAWPAWWPTPGCATSTRSSSSASGPGAGARPCARAVRRSCPSPPTCPWAVCGVTVFPGDWIYADASGAVVIPPGDVRAILEEAARIEERDAAEVVRMRAADALR